MITETVLEETINETIICSVARVGIISAHAFDFLGNYHTVVAVAVLWSVEELIALKVARRKLKAHSASHGNVTLEEKILRTFRII